MVGTTRGRPIETLAAFGAAVFNASHAASASATAVECTDGTPTDEPTARPSPPMANPNPRPATAPPPLRPASSSSAAAAESDDDEDEDMPADSLLRRTTALRARRSARWRTEQRSWAALMPPGRRRRRMSQDRPPRQRWVGRRGERRRGRWHRCRGCRRWHRCCWRSASAAICGQERGATSCRAAAHDRLARFRGCSGRDPVAAPPTPPRARVLFGHARSGGEPWRGRLLRRCGCWALLRRRLPSTDALSGGGAGGGTLQTTGYAQANGPGGGRRGGSGHSMLTSHGLAAARRRNEIPAHLLRELPTLASSGASSGGGGGGGGAGGRAGGGGGGGGGSGAGWSGGVDGAALAAQLSEAAFERIRAAFPPASLERRMFHELSGASSVPESDEHRRRRAADSFGRGVSLTATSAEPCCICLDTMCKGEVGLTLRCGGFHEHCIHSGSAGPFARCARRRPCETRARSMREQTRDGGRGAHRSARSIARSG